MKTSGIFDFDAKKLDYVLDKFGTKQAWINLLATHISQKDGFDYILRSNYFFEHKILNEDLLGDLTIGEISVLYEYSMARDDSGSRKSNGQFFTPDDVAKFMASFSSKFDDGVWLDPCSGIGNLSWHLVDRQKDPEVFLIRRMILSDKDELALVIARCLFTLSFQKNDKVLFETIENNFVKFDFLSVSDLGDLDLFTSKNELDLIPKHDFVIVNPPYLATSVDSRFETSKAGDLYAYFMENIVKTSKGFVSVTPQSFTNAQKFDSLRKLLLSHFKNLTIFTFDNVPANIFKGIKFGSKNSNQANSMRAAIMIALPGVGKPRITSLIRWRSNERSELFSHAEEFLSDVTLTKEFFPKVSKDLKKLYQSTRKNQTLFSLLSGHKTDFPLYIPSAPRYFIPALKSPVKRTSLKVLYFRNNRDRDRAYMLINSSFAYWWWRVRDGGMTLSLETLNSLPLLDFPVSKKLVAALEASELTSKVYKQNAGAPQENVKHAKSLISELNRAIVPDFADVLGGLHDNSEVTKLLEKRKP
jgi:hypothetical protein